MDAIARAVADPFKQNETITMSRVQYQLLIQTTAEDMHDKALASIMVKYKDRDAEQMKLIKECRDKIVADEVEINSLRGQLSAAKEDRGLAWSKDKDQLLATIARLEGKLQEQTNNCLESDQKVRQLQPALAQALEELEQAVKTSGLRRGKTLAYLDAAVEKIKDRWPNGNPFSDLFLRDLVQARGVLES